MPQKVERELKKRYHHIKTIFYILLALMAILILIDIGLFLVFKALKRETTVKVNVKGVGQEEAQELEDFLNQ